MNYSDFIVLLSRQRSGTNAVRSVLGSHPRIFCGGEAFSILDRTSEYPLERNTNYFTFLERYANGDVTAIFPDRQETVFKEFLYYLRTCTRKRFIVIDAKYNTCHILTPPFARSYPYLFDLVDLYGLRVLHLTRSNYLRCVLSQLKAAATGEWWNYVPQMMVATDRAIALDTGCLMERLRNCEAEDDLVRRHFNAYDKYFTCDYQEVFPTASGGAAARFLNNFADWLGIAPTFSPQPGCQKQSTLPLCDSILNYDEVVALLSGTRYEYCLDDEPIYGVS